MVDPFPANSSGSRLNESIKHLNRQDTIHRRLRGNAEDRDREPHWGGLPQAATGERKGPMMKLAAKLMLVFLVAVMLMTSVASYLTVLRAYERFHRREREMASVPLARSTINSSPPGGNPARRDCPTSLATSPPTDRRGKYAWPGCGEARRTRAWPRSSAAIRTEYGDCTCTARSRSKTACRSRWNSSARWIHWKRKLGTPIRIALVSIGGMAAVAVGMVYLAGLRWIARPLQQLTDKTRRAGAGDFSRPVSVSGRDELAELATALNQMCEQLSRQQEQIDAETAKRLTALEQLRHADRLKTVGRLAAGIAHELGTPLNVISGRAALIASGHVATRGAERERTRHQARSRPDHQHHPPTAGLRPAANRASSQCRGAGDCRAHG